MTTLQTVKNTALENYADRSVVNELVQRVMRFHPAIARGDFENPEQMAYQVAQLAILMGASPLPGLNEIHVDKKLGVVIGINYWERRGDQKGGVYWDIEARPMIEQEREMYDINPNQLAAICRGVPMNSIREMRALGFNMTQAIKAGAVTGIGVALKNEYAKNGRPLIWTAIKRAKADFYKSAFPYIPGERLSAGAGMQQTEQGYTPNFSDPMWEQELGWQARDEYERTEMTSDEMDSLNEEFFGNKPVKSAGEQPIEGEFEDVVQPEKVGNEPPSMDWINEAHKAKDVGEWAYRAFQTNDGQEIFKNAVDVKAWYGFVLGDYNPKRNVEAMAAFLNYCKSIADLVSQGSKVTKAQKTKAIDAAKKHYDTMVEMLSSNDEEE